MGKKNVAKIKLLPPVGYVVYLLAFMWFISIVVSFLEAYFYPGFVYRHTSIDPLFIYIAFGITGLFLQFVPKLENNRTFLIFRKLSYLATFVFGLIYLLLNLLEKINYPNYVFSTFHIQPKELSTLITLSIYTGLISSKDIVLANLTKTKKIFKKQFPIIIFLLWMIIPNIVDVGETAIQNLAFMIKNPLATYDQKMEEKVGKQFYDYVMFVKENTPEDAKILIPPFPAYPWPQTGNVPYIRYFLYPRVLLNGEEYSPAYDLKKEGIDYVLVVWGETVATSGSYTHGWPKFDVNADGIIYWRSDNNITIKKENYNYNNVKGQELWGVIRVIK